MQSEKFEKHWLQNFTPKFDNFYDNELIVYEMQSL